jgi:hypothetical protein
MLELIYIARFDYLAHPYMPESNAAPDDYAVAIAMAEADERMKALSDVDETECA